MVAFRARRLVWLAIPRMILVTSAIFDTTEDSDLNQFLRIVARLNCVLGGYGTRPFRTWVQFPGLMPKAPRQRMKPLVHEKG